MKLEGTISRGVETPSKKINDPKSRSNKMG